MARRLRPNKHKTRPIQPHSGSQLRLAPMPTAKLGIPAISLKLQQPLT